MTTLRSSKVYKDINYMRWAWNFDVTFFRSALLFSNATSDKFDTEKDMNRKTLYYIGSFYKNMPLQENKKTPKVKKMLGTKALKLEIPLVQIALLTVCY